VEQDDRPVAPPKGDAARERHTHVNQLIAAGLDVVTVSRRIGHSNPTVTLRASIRQCR